MIPLFSAAILASTILGLVENPPIAPHGDLTIKLWEQGAPGAKGTEPVDTPTLTFYFPPKEKQTGAAVVVCPGGGYGGHAGHESEPIAKWLNSAGVTGIVLKYRLGPRYQHPVMMNDVNRAIRLVRSRGKEWGIESNRIGVLGFSAGGHLASTAATHWTEGDPNASDMVDRVSSRPDLAVLIYPVITMDGAFTHGGSRRNLLGENPSKELTDLMSNDKQVNEKTPPAFIVHSANDPVRPEGSLLYAAACMKYKVPVEMLIFEHGGHGFGLGGSDPVLSSWPGRCAEWFVRRGFIGTKK